MAIFWAAPNRNPRQGQAGIWGRGTSSVASCWPSASRRGTSCKLVSWDGDSCDKKPTLSGHPWGPGTCTGPCTHAWSCPCKVGAAPFREEEVLSGHT